MSKIEKENKKKKKLDQKNKIENGNDKILFLLRNIAGLLFSLILIIILYQKIPGYKWLWDSLVISNQKMIKKYPDLSLEQKFEIKCGFDYKYLHFVKNNSPEDAIILMPSKEDIFPRGQKSDFNTKGSGGIRNKAWATYFLYPRKLVYEVEKDENPLYKKINYVAIVNYLGYEKLNYEVNKKQKYNILPINKSGGGK
jgi:hypothetical protein